MITALAMIARLILGSVLVGIVGPTLASAAPAPVATNVAYDGKVETLNAGAYSVLKAARKRAPDAFTSGAQLTDGEVEALILAVRKDGKLDDAERDLVYELTQGAVRGVNVYSKTAASGETKLLFFPLNGAPRNRLFTLLEMAKPVAAAAPTKTDPDLLDGKVTVLNTDAFATLALVRKRNPGAFNEVDAKELAAAINKDSKVDPVEADLLREMTQSQFRSITVTPVKPVPGAGDKVTLYPVSGNAKKVLQNVLNPPLDLSVEWAKPDHSWQQLVTDYKSSAEREAKVLAFVTEEMAKKWEASNMGNGYKPLRDEIAKIYGLCNTPGGDANSGRTLLYRAMNSVDRNAKDAVPDFLYNWVRPGGYL
ncbi:MAG: hypothetical protein IPL18_02945 [Sphingomonadales bacterium]|nr:hypothetical protein [Sphingomonadales bacterium]